MFWMCIDLNGKTAPLVHHVIVRADLPIGSQVAQSIHAAAESAVPKPEPGCIAIALHARNEDHLLQLSAALDARGINHHQVIEGDGEYIGQLMAIGVYPTRDRDAVKKVLSSLPLVR